MCSLWSKRFAKLSPNLNFYFHFRFDLATTDLATTFYLEQCHFSSQKHPKIVPAKKCPKKGLEIFQAEKEPDCSFLRIRFDHLSESDVCASAELLNKYQDNCVWKHSNTYCKKRRNLINNHNYESAIVIVPLYV